MNKPALIRALVAQLEDEIARATESANRTRQGATHEEAKPENDKDTRALEASYLARGQAQRVVDLEGVLQRVKFATLRDFAKDDAIDLSALVRVVSEDEDERESADSDPETRWYFLVPAGGGRRVEQDGVVIDVITPEAPLGRALVGRYRGESLQLRVGSRLRELSIAELR